MRSRKTPVAEQRELVAGAIAEQIRFLFQTKGETNPQIVDMRNATKGKLVAYEAVLQMMRDGDTILLRIDTESLA